MKYAEQLGVYLHPAIGPATACRGLLKCLW